MSKIGADKCFSPDGFNSYAPALISGGCAPGTIPRGCKAARRITATLGAGGTATIDIDPIQPLKVGAIVDLNSGADVSIDDLSVNKQSLFPRAEDESAAFVDGLGLAADLTPELYRSGLNPLPPQPTINKENPLRMDISSAAGGDLDVLVYLVNP